VFALAMKNGWAPANPVEDAARPRRRRDGDADPDLQFLTPAELDAVIEILPDLTVDRDSLGPVLRVLIRARFRPRCQARPARRQAAPTSDRKASPGVVRRKYRRPPISPAGNPHSATS
jgi:hypothetical protein